MDLTEGTYKEKGNRAKKMMLWFGIVSLLMAFAGWTSAYVVSSSRPDWLKDYFLPEAFLYSTIVIIISSITMHLSKMFINKNKPELTTVLLLITLVLSVLFVYLQFVGFSQIIVAGYHFTGPTSNITMSYIFLVTALHAMHVLAGIIMLLVVIYNHYKKRYEPGKTLGLELGVTFWHFLDFLWVYLILFLYFFR